MAESHPQNGEPPPFFQIEESVAFIDGSDGAGGARSPGIGKIEKQQVAIPVDFVETTFSSH
jgi:hypothetical protein